MWLALCASPTTYLIAIALLGTLLVKLVVLPSLGNCARLDIATVLTVCVPDVMLLGCAGALLAAGERVARARSLRLLLWLTRAPAALGAVRLFNGVFLSVTAINSPPA